MVLRHAISVLLMATGLQGSGQLVVELKDTVHAGAIGRIADRMIVAFDELAPIGVVQFQEVPANVFLDGPVGQSLMRQLHQAKTEQGPNREVVLKLGQLRMLQVGSNMQIGMHMEFLDRTPTGYARLYEHGVSFIQANAGKRDISHIILQAFQECMSAFEKNVSRNQAGRIVLDSAQVHSPMIRRASDLPARNDSTERSGIYRTYSDMLLDRPDSVGFAKRQMLRSLYDDQLVKLRDVDRDTRQSIWGFTDGEHIYKNLGGEFVRLERYDERFRARWKAPAQTDAGAMILGGLLGGLVGAALVGGISSTPGGIIQYELDLLSGDLWPVKERDARPGYQSVHLFEYSRFSKRDADVRVQIKGGEVVILNKSNWTVLRPEPRIAHATAIVRNSDDETDLLDLDTNAQRTEVYLIDMKADGSLSVKRLPEQMALKKIEGLKKEQRR